MMTSWRLAPIARQEVLTKGIPEGLIDLRADRYALNSMERAAKLNKPELARNADYIRAHLKTAEIGTRSVNKILTLFSMLYGYAAQHRWASFSPVEHVDKLLLSGRRESIGIRDRDPMARRPAHNLKWRLRYSLILTQPVERLPIGRLHAAELR